MVVRRRKKKIKLRGNRTHGKGNTKNKRGKGSSGGKGNAGYLETKWTWTVKYDPERFGKHGFHSIHKKKKSVITLRDINAMIENNRIEKKDNNYYLEFDGKVLATGELNYPVIIKARSFSEGVKEKVEKAKGSIEKI
ncbi:MAG: uL15 family ribosomal protein [Candidatus Micrarchaeota archaeon]|nr:uL15 family ribosomal protein [Candidatus Micrarchaeota archaeon]